MTHITRPFGLRGGAGSMLGLALAASVAVTACDGVLDVEIPGQVTEAESFLPSQAELLVNSAISDIECSFSDFIAFSAAGAEDATSRTVGWWGGAFEYDAAPGTANCSIAETSLGWFTPLHKGRWMAEQTYARMQNEWTAAEVPARERLMGTAAIYAGLAYTQLGEHLCEVTADAGPLMSWDQSLGAGEEWFTKAIGHIGAAGDFAIATGVTGSASQMAHLLRARARFGKGDLAGALADAQQIQQGFTSFITRESGGERHRWNRVFAAHVGLGWVALLGPVDWWSGAPNPATGQPWPAVIPFTGYWDLAVLPDGRAISATQHPITLAAAGAVADPRVPVQNLGTTGGDRQYPMWQQQKYRSADTNIPLAKWEEAWLIRAQIQGGQAAIDLVNVIRAAHGLPLVTYLNPADQDAIRDMLIEEIRRTHFMEGRFWSTKLRYDLWFPRGQGRSMWGHTYRNGVRMVMPGAEFNQNPNLVPDDQGSRCPPFQSPTT